MSVSVPIRSLSDIADDINQTALELENSDKMTGSEVEPDMISSSSSSFTCSKADLLKAKEMEAIRIARQEMYAKLKARKEDLQRELFSKITKLRELCLKEAELTGVVPPELSLTPGEPHPQIRKRIGTTFVLSPKFLNDGTFNEEDEMKKLEMEFEIQEKIMEAERQLAQDKSLQKSVRKKHRRTYRQAYQKLKELEGKINALREETGRERVVVSARSLDDLSEDSREFLDDDTEPDTSSTPSENPTSANLEPEKMMPSYYRRYTHHELSSLLRHPGCGTPKAEKEHKAPKFYSPEGSLTWSTSLGGDDVTSLGSTALRIYPKKVGHSSLNPRSSPCRSDNSAIMPGSSRVHSDGCSIGSAQSSECQYPTHPLFSKRKQSGSSLGSDFTNSCSSSLSSLQQNSMTEREENLYNINTYLTGCYESGDELLNPSDNNSPQWPTKHGSLDRRHTNAQTRYDGNCLSGSLEMPELMSPKGYTNPDPAVDHCGTSVPGDTSQSGSNRLLRKNCSERFHNRQREKLIDQVSTCSSARGLSASNVYHYPRSLERTIITTSPADGKAKQRVAPVMYVASPTGRFLDCQVPFDAFSVPRVNTAHTPQPIMSASTDNPVLGNEFNRTEAEENLPESPLIEVLDSPDKLAIFRKGRYGRCMTGSATTPLPSGHNKDAVDALFRHHEECISFSAYGLQSPPVTSSPSSAALYESSELLEASTPTPDNSVI